MAPPPGSAQVLLPLAPGAGAQPPNRMATILTSALKFGAIGAVAGAALTLLPFIPGSLLIGALVGGVVGAVAGVLKGAAEAKKAADAFEADQFNRMRPRNGRLPGITPVGPDRPAKAARKTKKGPRKVNRPQARPTRARH